MQSDELFNTIASTLRDWDLPESDHEEISKIIRQYGDASYSEGVVSAIPD